MRSFSRAVSPVRIGLFVAASIVAAGCGGGAASAPATSFPVATPTPSGSGTPIASNSTYTTPPALNGDVLRISFGSGVPAGETISYIGVAPPGVMMTANFYIGAAFTIGPSPMPFSAIAGVTLVPGKPPATGFASDFYQEQPSFAHAATPFAVAPSTTFTPGDNDPTPTLVTLSSGALYFIAVYTR
jgi:hypothetical protein